MRRQYGGNDTFENGVEIVRGKGRAINKSVFYRD